MKVRMCNTNLAFIPEMIGQDLQFTSIMYKVIVLVEERIRFLLKQLKRPEVHATIERAMGRIRDQVSPSDDAGEARFRQWICNLPVLASLDNRADYAQLIAQVKWASEARWNFSEQLESFLEPDNGELPPCLWAIYKLGRFYTATKTMIKLASTQPAIFTGIHIEAIQAPEKMRFSLEQEKNPLLTVLKKITKADPEKLKSNLGQLWFREDPELHFRRACRNELTVHAEMQLLSFYDHYTDLTPRLLFMGTSKKACYLCHEFMSRHPLAMSMSATHQKLYPTWMPAPCSSSVRKRHKVLLWEFSRHLEDTTARDLETRLGIKRPKTLDSTTGPSMTSSWTSSMEVWSLDLPVRSLVGSEDDAERKLE